VDQKISFFVCKTSHAATAIVNIFGSCLWATFNFDWLIFIVILQLVWTASYCGQQQKPRNGTTMINAAREVNSFVEVWIMALNYQ